LVAGALCVLAHKDIGLIVQGPQAGEQALARKCHGVGLIRSEYPLPPKDRSPDADYFESVFECLCDVARPLPLTVRLVDIAAGK